MTGLFPPISQKHRGKPKCHWLPKKLYTFDKQNEGHDDQYNQPNEVEYEDMTSDQFRKWRDERGE